MKFAIAMLTLLTFGICTYADTFDFAITGGVQASGVITIGPLVNLAGQCDGFDGLAPILTFTGDLNGDAVTFLNPASQGDCNASGGALDAEYSGSGSFFLWSNPILFMSGGDEWQLGRTDGDHADGWEYILLDLSTNTLVNQVDGPIYFSSVDPPDPMPEAQTLPMIFWGIGLLLALRRVVRTA